MPIDCALREALRNIGLNEPLSQTEVETIKALHSTYLARRYTFWGRCKRGMNMLGFLLFCCASGCLALYLLAALLIGLSFPISVVYLGSDVQQIGGVLLLGALVTFAFALMTVPPEHICGKMQDKMQWRQRYLRAQDLVEELPPHLAATAKILVQYVRKKGLSVSLGKEESAKGVFLFFTQERTKKRTHITFEEK